VDTIVVKGPDEGKESGKRLKDANGSYMNMNMNKRNDTSAVRNNDQIIITIIIIKEQ
jgi:hypothetical protein